MTKIDAYTVTGLLYGADSAVEEAQSKLVVAKHCPKLTTEDIDKCYQSLDKAIEAIAVAKNLYMQARTITASAEKGDNDGLRNMQD